MKGVFKFKVDYIHVVEINNSYFEQTEIRLSDGVGFITEMSHTDRVVLYFTVEVFRTPIDTEKVLDELKQYFGHMKSLEVC